MKILACTFYKYYGSEKAIEPQYYYLYKVPESMGFDMNFFDYKSAADKDVKEMRTTFLNLLKKTRYDAVFIATHRDEFDEETLMLAKKYAPIIAWNSDDEVRWDNYSKNYVNHYTWMVTNSFTVFNSQRKTHKNLIHAQWACTGFWEGTKSNKDINFSFVGQIYGPRYKEIEYLIKTANLQAFGKGSTIISLGKYIPNSQIVSMLSMGKAYIQQFFPSLLDDSITFSEVNKLWNRSKISFTPLESSWGKVTQIKSRIFDMGLSGTTMLAPRSGELSMYYEPMKEYIPFSDLAECPGLVSYYLNHESQRAKIAIAYANRTKKEHLWKYRIQHVLKEAHINV